MSTEETRVKMEMYTSLAKESETLEDESRDVLLREFYYAGYTHEEMSNLLHYRCNVKLSVRQIRRCLSKMSFRRPNEECVRKAIGEELKGSGQCLGNRSMQKRLLQKYGLKVSRYITARILKDLDPEGVRLRTNHRLSRRRYVNKGPNFAIHIDGYDKLKRYGFAIHGAICGFSRRVLWLKVNRSNNNPKIIAGYFHEYLDEIKGVPRCVRGDRGTENCIVEDIQKAFRWYHFDDMKGEKSYLSGKSTSNQRIERWWLSNKQGGVLFWINYFKDLEAVGDIRTDDNLMIEALRFCFTRLIQEDLNRCRQEWNQHYIRKTKNGECPAGKPDLMFYCPELYGTVDYKTDVEIEDLDALVEVCEYPLPSGCDHDSNHFFEQLCTNSGKEMPSCPDEALLLYNWLISCL